MNTLYKGKRSKTDILNGVKADVIDSIKLGNNTVKYWIIEPGIGSISIIRFHDTDIIKIMPDGLEVYNTGGWLTVTTKERLNEYASCRFWSQKGQWYVSSKCRDMASAVMFYDGITYDPESKSFIDYRPPKQNDRELKRIREFCKHFVNALPVKLPGNGDCFYCHMVDEKTGKPLGDATGDHDHLWSHIEEKYYVPSLLFNALKEANAAQAWYWDCFVDPNNPNRQRFFKDVSYWGKQYTRYLFKYLKTRLIDKRKV